MIWQKPKAGLLATMIDDELVMLAGDSGQLFSLCGTALAIWNAIDGERDEQAIAMAVAMEYDEAEERIARDVAAFVGELSSAGLLERRPIVSAPEIH